MTGFERQAAALCAALLITSAALFHLAHRLTHGEPG